MDGVTFQPGNTFSGLTAGTYTVYVSDANNCVVSGTFTVTQPTPVAFTSNATDLTCFADNSGFILLDGSGGQSGVYQYSITNSASFQTDPFFFNLPAGTYPIVVKDAAGCPASGNIVLTEPAALTAGLTTQDVSCSNSCDGMISITASGGTSPYFYSVDNGVTLLVNPAINGLCTGAYSVQTVDDNGCVLTSPAVIGSPAPLSLNTVPAPSTCGLPNGSVTASAGGGIPGYTYSIDNVNFGPGATFSGLGAGAYTVYTEDAQGCAQSAPVVVNGQSSPVVTGVSGVNASCNAVCDGSITITAAGGTGTIQYSIGGPFQVSNVFTGLCAGSYMLSITDNNGCVTGYGVPFVITEPAVLTFTTNQTDLTCFGNGTGVIDFQAQGGTIPYQYSISNGGALSSTDFFTLLDAGTYDLLVQDINGCVAAGQVTLTQPPLLEIIDLQTSDALCFETCNGTATVAAQGGTSTTAYTYNWYTVTTNVNAPQIADLCAGSYTSVVLDQNGCYDTVQFSISEPAPMTIDSIVANNVLCNGACDGSIALWSSGASLYSFDGGVTYVPNNTMTGLCQGSYDVFVQSTDGCLASVTSVVLSDPPLLSVMTGPDSILCTGTSGILYALATGGTEPYTYYWDNENQGPSLIVVPVNTTSYDVYVQDANGCLSNPDSTLLSLYQDLTTTVTADTAICPGASLAMTVNVLTGVPGYNYTWYTSGSTIATTAGTTVSPDSPTAYIVITADQCTTVSDTVNVTTFTLPDPVFGVSEPTGCIPMEVALYPVIDPQLLNGNCTWTFSNGTVVNGCDTIHAIFSDPGCYSVTFASETVNGCSVEGYGENVFCVVPNPEAEFTFDPQPTYISPEVQFQNLSENASNYNWTFTGYASSQEENPEVSFNHTDAGGTIDVCLTATNLLGCSDQVCLPVVMGDEFVFYVPNAFTPDDDMHNQAFAPVFPKNFDLTDYELLIFNRWGEILFESHDPAVGWSGMYADKLAEDGVYTWKITVRDVRTNRLHDMIGHVSLIR
jgi:gliding motility-associated-like protein